MERRIGALTLRHHQCRRPLGHRRLVGGVSVTEDFWGLLLVALVFGLVNAFIRPIVKVLTPLTILTLGLFTFV